YVSLLQKKLDGKLDERTEEYMVFAIEGAKRMRTLIDDLLAYSRVNARSQPFRLVDMNVVAMQAVSNLDASIKQSKAHVVAMKLPTVIGDEGQLVQLVQNLLSNAIKFHSNEDPEVEIGAEKKEGMWRFSIKDNGVGIDPKYRQKVFEMFQRLNPDEFPGTGIGLPISKKIVERHGGAIWVESDGPGSGSTFYFTIPQIEA
ncbi:MAG TPA: ATP-binding protein, partial [Methanomassiliicoccales archaeon]|nr:ATP-binding protein [Methanomassiliicoccales archaeon]